MNMLKQSLTECGLIVTVALGSFCATATAQTFTTLKSFGVLTNVSGYHPNSPLVQGPDGALYGTTSEGEGNVHGTVFKVQPDGTGFTVLKWFTNVTEGAWPVAGLTLSGSTVYGTTQSGGSSNNGTVFKVNTNGTSFAVLKHFSARNYDPNSGDYTNSDGGDPAGLTLANGELYGTMFGGGSLGHGLIFKLNTDGTGFTVLKDFIGSEGRNPRGSLTLSVGVLYGTTGSGGSNDFGTVFKMNMDGTGYTVLKHFTGGDGSYPGGLTLSDGVLYGTAYESGNFFYGTVFKLNTDGIGFAVLKHFTVLDGVYPSGGLTLSGNVLYGTTTDYGGGNSVGTLFQVNTDGTGFLVLKHFTNPEGSQPLAGVTLSGSTLYGTTAYGGVINAGTIFKLNTDGSGYTVLKQFAESDGWEPASGLTLSGSTLYGTTVHGGSLGAGTVFMLSTNGTGYVMLKQFGIPINDPSTGSYTNADGALPFAGLALSGGVLYGAAEVGGSFGSGTVFKMNTDGTGYTVLKSFSFCDCVDLRTNSDGAYPSAVLTLSGSVLYGTTPTGGNAGNGTVFKMNTDGSGFTVIKHFTGADGVSPQGGLTLSGSVLYGAAPYGNSGSGTVFKLNTDGTGFTVLKSFSDTVYEPGLGSTNSDGAQPSGRLEVSGEILYGTTYIGGISGGGTVFRLNTDGTGFIVLKHLSQSDGVSPSGGVRLSGSSLYGAAKWGGGSGVGTLFKVNTDGTGFTVLKHFTGGDGEYPGELMLSGNVLYGTTAEGGDWDYGTVFKIDLSGALIPIALNAQRLGGNLILNWSNPAFALQAAPEVTGTYTNIPGATSPYTNASVGPQQFFRLIGN